MNWLSVLQACAPILVALVGIIPTIISNRKKTTDKLDELKTDVNSVKRELADHIRLEEDDKARQARIRILRFDDELCEGIWHNENYFEDILDDINLYRKHVSTHPDFKNSIGETAMEHVIDTYKRIKSTGGFIIRNKKEKKNEVTE